MILVDIEAKIVNKNLPNGGKLKSGTLGSISNWYHDTLPVVWKSIAVIHTCLARWIPFGGTVSPPHSLDYATQYSCLPRRDTAMRQASLSCLTGMNPDTFK